MFKDVWKYDLEVGRDRLRVNVQRYPNDGS
jgi:hypothetical protein